MVIALSVESVAVGTFLNQAMMLCRFDFLSLDVLFLHCCREVLDYKSWLAYMHSRPNCVDLRMY